MHASLAAITKARRHTEAVTGKLTVLQMGSRIPWVLKQRLESSVSRPASERIPARATWIVRVPLVSFIKQVLRICSRSTHLLSLQGNARASSSYGCVWKCSCAVGKLPWPACVRCHLIFCCFLRGTPNILQVYIKMKSQPENGLHLHAPTCLALLLRNKNGITIHTPCRHCYTYATCLQSRSS